MPFRSTMNMYSNAGDTIVYPDVKAPKYADLLPGLAYSITVSNSTGADITSGTLTIEGADAREDDPCAPDAFSPVDELPNCDEAPGTVIGPARIQFTPENPLRVGQKCQYAIPCPPQFIRIADAPAGVDVGVVLTRLRRTDFRIGTSDGRITQIPGPFGGEVTTTR